tara:strand:+ start:60 stop:440 length:381 start_codon:yes stop_codon:yes gene_type:complete
MRFKKSEIKTGYWVQLGKQPMHNGKTFDKYVADHIVYYQEMLKIPYGSDSYIRKITSQKRVSHKPVRYVTNAHIKRIIKGFKKPRWVKVLGTRDGLKYRDTMGLSSTFYMYWVTAIVKSKSETREV